MPESLMTVSANLSKPSAVVAKVEAAAAAGRLSAGSVANIKRWLTVPPYRKYVPRIVQLVDAEQFVQLDALFWEVVPFGTGGRRGTMAELGSATINERTIAESAHGLAVYLNRSSGIRKNSDATADVGGILANSATGLRGVIARDTRHRSDEFARLTATTLAAHGLTVFFFESHRSTPELSFAVRHLKCDVGVVISASHNPPSDNGFKAYWSSGAQVLSPHDQGIIDCVYEAGEIPTVDFDEAVRDGRIQVIGDDVDRAYVEAVTAMSLSDARDVPAIYSSMHGVGETSVLPVIQAAGFSGVQLFEPYRSPDGGFPNVPDHYPNPERPVVFDPIIPQAKEIGADLILATDPDADRLGVVVCRKDGGTEHLTGNRIGALLVDYILRKRAAQGTLSPAHYVVETLVTTPLIAAIAQSHGVRVIDDLLVGFKYIAETMDAEGPERFVFGAEESLGYLAGQYARDKDAAIAAIYLLEDAAELRRDGRTLLDRLDELFVEHGYHQESQASKVCTGASGKEQIDRLMTAFRESPPTVLAGVPLARIRDYGRHEIRALPDNSRIEELSNPSGNLLFLESAEADGDFRIAVRPSGTEPKIKFYFFARQLVADAAALPAARTKCDERLMAVTDELMQWIDECLET
jgi:phosphoglucomutase/phosphomannomutase